MDFLLHNKAPLLFALGVLMLIVLLMRRWNRYFKRQRRSKPDARAAALADSRSQQPLMDAPPELLRWQVEMHETARELKAEIDTKIAVLERLTIDARQQAERLEAAMHQGRSLESASMSDDT